MQQNDDQRPIPCPNQSQVAKIEIPLPSLPVQRHIAEISGTVNEKLELHMRRKERLQRIEKGLMNDLLTGKKRVKWKCLAEEVHK